MAVQLHAVVRGSVKAQHARLRCRVTVDVVVGSLIAYLW